MAAKPLTKKEITLTEKKMDMTLDDIIKMSKNPPRKNNKQQRVPIKNRRPMNNGSKDKALKVRQYMDSWTSVRQATFDFDFLHQVVLAASDSLMPLVIERSPIKVGAPPVKRRAPSGGFVAKLPQQQKQHQQQDRLGNTVAKQKPKTLDSLFANMKEERMKVFSAQNNGARPIFSAQNNGVRPNGGGRQRRPWGRGRFGN